MTSPSPLLVRLVRPFGLFAVAALATLAACSHLPHQDPYTGKVVVAQDHEVVNCEYVDHLDGSSGLAGLFALKGADNIRNHLLFEADAKGATHVVFDKPSAEYDRTTLSGKAYRCPPAKP
jgi:hypothetical protein